MVIPHDRGVGSKNIVFIKKISIRRKTGRVVLRKIKEIKTDVVFYYFRHLENCKIGKPRQGDYTPGKLGQGTVGSSRKIWHGQKSLQTKSVGIIFIVQLLGKLSFLRGINF